MLETTFLTSCCNGILYSKKSLHITLLNIVNNLIMLYIGTAVDRSAVYLLFLSFPIEDLVFDYCLKHQKKLRKIPFQKFLFPISIIGKICSISALVKLNQIPIFTFLFSANFVKLVFSTNFNNVQFVS